MLEHEAPYVMHTIEARNRPLSRLSLPKLAILSFILALLLCGTLTWLATNPPNPAPAGQTLR